MPFSCSKFLFIFLCFLAQVFFQYLMFCLQHGDSFFVKRSSKLIWIGFFFLKWFQYCWWSSNTRLVEHLIGNHALCNAYESVLITNWRFFHPKTGTHPTLVLVIVKFQSRDDNNLSTQGKPSFSVTCTLVPLGED